MKIPKAIEILAPILAYTEEIHDQDLNAAIKLGIEALKQIQIHRTYGYAGLNFRLAGEDPQ